MDPRADSNLDEIIKRRSVKKGHKRSWALTPTNELSSGEEATKPLLLADAPAQIASVASVPPSSAPRDPDAASARTSPRVLIIDAKAVIQVPVDSRDSGKEDTRSGGSAGSESAIIRPGAPCDPNEYNFNNKRRGLFMVVNNKTFDSNTGQIPRDGTDIDAERLEERFQDIGFEVRRFNDLTVHQMTSLMYSIAAEDHSDTDCFGCAILSHGREGRVYARDGTIGLDMLVLPFKGDRCPTLLGKPKLFFIQACRGARLDQGADVTDSSSSSENLDDVDSGLAVIMRKIPVEADFLFAYSTVPGYYSWRNNQDGSWFVQALCLVIENQGSKMELLHMLTRVNRIVAYDFESCTDDDFSNRAKQMPCIVSMLTRYVYFRPKKSNIIS